MEKLNITAGQNYKVMHKKTKVVHFMNAQEVADFVFKYGHKNYSIKNLNRRTVDKIPALVLYVLLFGLTLASILLYIQLNY